LHDEDERQDERPLIVLRQTVQLTPYRDRNARHCGKTAHKAAEKTDRALGQASICRKDGARASGQRIGRVRGKQEPEEHAERVRVQEGKKIDRGWNPEDAGEQERCGASQLDARPQRK